VLLHAIAVREETDLSLIDKAAGTEVLHLTGVMITEQSKPDT